jgi:hypothetical protein
MHRGQGGYRIGANWGRKPWDLLARTGVRGIMGARRQDTAKCRPPNRGPCCMAVLASFVSRISEPLKQEKGRLADTVQAEERVEDHGCGAV